MTINSLVCCTEDEEGFGNEFFAQAIKDESRAIKMSPALRLRDDAKNDTECEPSGIIAVKADRRIKGNPETRGETFSEFMRSGFPESFACAFDTKDNLVVFVQFKSESPAEDYKKIGTMQIKDYRGKLLWRLCDIDEPIEFGKNRSAQVWDEVMREPSREEIDRRMPEPPERRVGTVEGKKWSARIQIQGGGADSFQTIMDNADPEQQESTYTESTPAVKRINGIVNRAEWTHEEIVDSMTIKAYTEPKPEDFPELEKGVVKKSDTNIIWFIENCLKLVGVHNVMTKEEYLLSKKTHMRFAATLNEVSLICSLFERYAGWADYKRTARCIGAMIANNKVHPFLDSIPNWDKRDHFGYLLDTIKLPKDWNPCAGLFTANGKPMKPRDYVRAILEPWMVCAYKRVKAHLANIPSADYPINCVPVFQGPQGCLKNTFIKRLCFVENMLEEKGHIEIGNKDNIACFLSHVIVHLDEIDTNTASKKDASALKQLITCSTYSYRAPYDRRAINYVNQCSFIGTTNKDEYLVDESGNRRFFTIPVTGFDMDKVIDIPQVWAQIKYEADHGFPHFVPRNIEQASCKFNETIVDMGMAEVYGSFVQPVRNPQDADEHFSSVESTYRYLYEVVHGRTSPDFIPQKAKDSLAAVLKRILRTEQTLSQTRVSIKTSDKRIIKVYPLKLVHPSKNSGEIYS